LQARRMRPFHLEEALRRLDVDLRLLERRLLLVERLLRRGGFALGGACLVLGLLERRLGSGEVALQARELLVLLPTEEATDRGDHDDDCECDFHCSNAPLTFPLFSTNR